MEAEKTAALLRLVNEAARQLQTDQMDPGALLDLVPASSQSEDLVPLSAVFVDGVPPSPTGPMLRSLPTISRASGGVVGLWVFAGDTGIGKTALALQVAVEVARTMPVLLYDVENGRAVIAHRIGGMYRGDVEKARKATERIYYRDSIASLTRDLRAVPPPALLVIDSLQSLPLDIRYEASALSAWVYRFEALAKQGYATLLLSEKPRSEYGAVSLRGFRGSGSIEYKATFGVQLIAGEEDGTIEVHVVKNRYRPEKGHIVSLRRDPERAWVFREVPVTSSYDDAQEVID